MIISLTPDQNKSWYINVNGYSLLLSSPGFLMLVKVLDINRSSNNLSVISTLKG